MEFVKGTIGSYNDLNILGLSGIFMNYAKKL